MKIERLRHLTTNGMTIEKEIELNKILGEYLNREEELWREKYHSKEKKIMEREI